MTTYKALVTETVTESVRELRKEMADLYPTEFELELEREGAKLAEEESLRWNAFIKANGKEAYYALYQEPYIINRELGSTGLMEVKLRNERTGLVMAAAGTEAVAIQRFEQLKQSRTGRPSEMAGGKKVNTYLDAESIAIASDLGNGNVSDGIRKALKNWGLGIGR